MKISAQTELKAVSVETGELLLYFVNLRFGGVRGIIMVLD